MADRIRVVVTEPGPGGPDRGAETMARALRDAGAEVVWTGPNQTPDQIARTVIQEDADALAIAGDDPALRRQLAALLEHDGAEDVALFDGGAGTSGEELVAWVRRNMGPSGA